MLAPLVPHYHVGIVVKDLAAAQAELTEQLGVTWGPTLRLDEVEYRTPDGEDIALPTAMCYSVEAPHLELIEELPGSVWVCNEHSNLHHLGFWSDDLPGDSERLAASGCPLELAGRAGTEAPVTFTYQRGELGVRIEVVDAGMRQALAGLFRPAD
jgi:catechol 2,3-dioxygenase-like lactoylglutathione lyase family enzyme